VVGDGACVREVVCMHGSVGAATASDLNRRRCSCCRRRRLAAAASSTVCLTDRTTRPCTCRRRCCLQRTTTARDTSHYFHHDTLCSYVSKFEKSRCCQQTIRACLMLWTISLNLTNTHDRSIDTPAEAKKHTSRSSARSLSPPRNDRQLFMRNLMS
jgi:hypothetical protein